jgi:hypothetical protein
MSAVQAGAVARLAPDSTLVRVAATGPGQHVLIVMPGGRREFVEERFLVVSAAQEALNDARAFATADELARVRAATDAHVIAAEAERQACARAFAASSLAMNSGATGSSAGAGAPSAVTGAAAEGQKWVRSLLGEGGDGSALAAENARLRCDLSEARSRLEEARAKLAASGSPDRWVADHESQSKALESVVARNRVLETALSTAEAQLRRTETASAAECRRLRKELSISEGRARGYQAVAAALEEQVGQLKEQLANAALQRPFSPVDASGAQ